MTYSYFFPHISHIGRHDLSVHVCNAAVLPAELQIQEHPGCGVARIFVQLLDSNLQALQQILSQGITVSSHLGDHDSL